MINIFAELEVNPFEDDVVTEPRRFSFSVEGLNNKPLEKLIARFRELTEGEMPRRQIAAQKAQLVVSPNRGYGKSHLLGRLFKHLGEEATLIYLRPFQDPQRSWSSILQATIQELERPSQNGEEAGSQLEAFSKGTPTQARGIAFGGDCGVAHVDLSTDGGKSWHATQLGRDEGKYGFRQWHTRFTLPLPGKHSLMIRCINRDGVEQPNTPVWNPAGYMLNTIESTHVIAA